MYTDNIWPEVTEQYFFFKWNYNAITSSRYHQKRKGNFQKTLKQPFWRIKEAASVDKEKLQQDKQEIYYVFGKRNAQKIVDIDFIKKSLSWNREIHYFYGIRRFLKKHGLRPQITPNAKYLKLIIW